MTRSPVAEAHVQLARLFNDARSFQPSEFTISLTLAASEKPRRRTWSELLKAIWKRLGED